MPTPLASFSAIAQGKAVRNLANQDDLDSWLQAIGDEKLGQGERAEKARSWLSTVARKAMLRTGHASPLPSDEMAKLAEAEPWAKKALAEGRPVLKLELSDGERSELLAILDWMRSDQGPSASSDWTRVSWPQALESHQRWIDAMAKSAAKFAAGTQALDGCEPACPVEGVAGLEGWSWVKPTTPEALNREGALMRHCVGSYAKEVADGDVEIWSLRDPAGHPHITVETAARGDDGGQTSIRQFKSFANGAPKPRHAAAIGPLLSLLASQGRPATHASPDLARSGLALTPKGFGEAKLWSKGSDADAAEALARCEALKKPGAQRALAIAGMLGPLGFKQAMKTLAAKAPASMPDHERLALARLARQAGLALGSGRLMGRAIDRGDPADLAACLALASAPPTAEHAQNFVAEGGFYAREGLLEPLSLAIPLLSTLCNQHQRAAIAEEALASREPCAIGAKAFSEPLGLGLLAGRDAWTAGDGAAALALSSQLTQDPTTDPDLALRACAAFARLGLMEACQALGGFLGHAKASPAASADAVKAIESAQGLVCEPVLGQPPMVWIPGVKGEAQALSWLGSNPESARAFLPVCLRMGYDKAAESCWCGMGDKEALDAAHRMLRRNVDPGRLGVHEGMSRESAEELRLECMRRGLVEGAMSANEALSKLPDSAYATPDEAEEQRASYTRWTRVFEDIKESVRDAASDPDIVKALTNKKATSTYGPGASDGGCREMLEALPSWRSLADRLAESHHVSVGYFAECLSSHLATRLPVGARSSTRPQGQPSPLFSAPAAPLECDTVAVEAISMMVNDIGLGADQRRALIRALSGMSRMENGKPWTSERAGQAAPAP